jgi:hypothetical protein
MKRSRTRRSSKPPEVEPPLRATLDGPSRTITVEPVETPAPAPPPTVEPERRPPEREPAPAQRPA